MVTTSPLAGVRATLSKFQPGASATSASVHIATSSFLRCARRSHAAANGDIRADSGDLAGPSCTESYPRSNAVPAQIFECALILDGGLASVDRKYPMWAFWPPTGSPSGLRLTERAPRARPELEGRARMQCIPRRTQREYEFQAPRCVSEVSTFA